MILAIPWWFLIVFALGAVFALRRFYHGFAIGWWLRSAAVCGGLMILAKPALVREIEREVPRKVVVLEDASGSMELTDPGADLSRTVQVSAVLDGGLRDALKEHYDLEEIQFSQGGATDLAKAFRSVTESSARGELAGIVLLSDGRDTGGIEGRRLGGELAKLKAMGSPIVAVPVGKEAAPCDAAVLSISAPEFIYLGDRLKIAAQIKADQLSDKSLTVTLERDGEILDTKIRQGAGVVALSHVPEAVGSARYAVRVAPLKGEAFLENNLREFSVAIGNDRKHVLLADRVPRWEFRYLRNLLFARDKSIQLQHVLLEPETLPGTSLPKIVASSERKFGEAEATALPDSFDGWAAFDAILLGDVKLDLNQWELVEKVVRERGAFLVLSAGRDGELQNVPDSLLPIEVRSEAGRFEEFRFQPARAGIELAPFKIGDSKIGDAQVWKRIPELRWRFPAGAIKPGAEVLAYADSGDRAEGLLQMKALEDERALVVGRRLGGGRVVCILTDETWRFRYGAGDHYHHRFWGQLLRWGTGPLLADGNDSGRVGTDRAGYETGDTVALTVKLSKDRPKRLTASVADRKIPLLPDPQASPGTYRGVLGSFPEPGDFTVVVTGGGEGINTSFSVFAPQRGIELADVTLDRAQLEFIAGETGGAVLAAEKASQAVSYFGAPRRTIKERRETALWDTWGLLAAILSCLIAEWILRRRLQIP